VIAALQVGYRPEAAEDRDHAWMRSAMEIREVPTPQPGPGEVLVRVRFTTLNRKDIFALRGLTGPGLRPRPPLPHVNGGDFVGEIAALGPGVQGWAPGDRVTGFGALYCGECEYCRMGEQTACLHYGLLGEQVWGAHAEYVVVQSKTLERVPEDADGAEVACALSGATTAWRAIVTAARAQPGETVLILGASGGVGSAAIQIARLAGCRVIAVVGGEWKVRRALEVGADYAVDHTREDFLEAARRITGGRGVDVVLDPVGAATWRRSINALRMFGRMTICGATSGDSPDISIREIYQSHRRILGTPVGNRTDFVNVLRCIYRGQLKPVIHARLPLREIHRGLAMMQERDFFGKIVLTV
jgi:NADPH:quinone reductase-like Zn-dependent oxidoreductase